MTGPCRWTLSPSARREGPHGPRSAFASSGIPRRGPSSGRCKSSDTVERGGARKPTRAERPGRRRRRSGDPAGLVAISASGRSAVPRAPGRDLGRSHGPYPFHLVRCAPSATRRGAAPIEHGERTRARPLPSRQPGERPVQVVRHLASTPCDTLPRHLPSCARSTVRKPRRHSTASARFACLRARSPSHHARPPLASPRRHDSSPRAGHHPAARLFQPHHPAAASDAHHADAVAHREGRQPRRREDARRRHRRRHARLRRWHRRAHRPRGRPRRGHHAVP